jgi:hypothetical protein
MTAILRMTFQHFRTTIGNDSEMQDGLWQDMANNSGDLEI